MAPANVIALGRIAVVVKAATFSSCDRRLDDELGDERDVA
jgi:hypothetical protein